MILDSFKLDGKTALVSGCRRGLGLAMAEAVAEAGADVVGVSATLEPEGSDVQAAVQATGRSFKGYTCDFSDRTALYAFIESVKSECAPIDILINNAGTVARHRAAEYPDEAWDHVIEVNLNAQFIITREFGKDMVARGNGKIIFIASVLTFQGGYSVVPYAASKGGIGQLTKAFANEWARKGVNVNAIAPGYFVTDITSSLRDDEARNRGILSRIPMGRWGDPEDLKGLTVYLSSAASDYMHGSVVNLDGGWMSH